MTLLAFFSLSWTGITMGGVYAYTQLTQGLPAIEAVSAHLNVPDTPTQLLDRTSQHVLYTHTNPVVPQRMQLTLETQQPDLYPHNLIAATLAIEDPFFWQHGGVDWSRMTDPHDELDPPFDVPEPAHWRGPLVFNSPHSGFIYPRRFLETTRLDLPTLRRSEDTFVDELFAGVAPIDLDLDAPSDFAPERGR